MYIYIYGWSLAMFIHEPLTPRVQFLGSQLGSASSLVPDLPPDPDRRGGRGGEAVSTEEFSKRLRLAQAFGKG